MFFPCSDKKNVLRQVKPVSCASRQRELPGDSPEHRGTAAPGISPGDTTTPGIQLPLGVVVLGRSVGRRNLAPQEVRTG